MELRKATSQDIELLTDNRLEFVQHLKNIDNKEEFRLHTREYLQKHMNDDSLIAFLAIDAGKIVSSCVLCIYDTLPTPSCPIGRKGLLLNVYTLSEYRRQGLASQLLRKLIEEAKQLGVSKIYLDYTNDGYPVYKKLGFEELHREMALTL